MKFNFKEFYEKLLGHFNGAWAFAVLFCVCAVPIVFWTYTQLRV